MFAGRNSSWSCPRQICHRVNSVILAFRSDKSHDYRWLTAVMLCWATWVSLSRVFVGKHFLGDVLVGIAIGTALGLAFGALARWVIRRFGWK